MEVLFPAVALDLPLGDPPSRFHPVAWIGRLIALGRRWADRVPTDLLIILYGAFLIVVVTSWPSWERWQPGPPQAGSRGLSACSRRRGR